ncbi:transposase [Streptomyces phaeochromogenes]|uniref:transposase n=1 Tax=Streptomyces phaeochromogenes TaxID=1923 RepID=UPI0033D0BC17
MISVHGAGRSGGRAVGGTGAVVAEGTKAGWPPVWPRRQLIGDIRFRARTGVPWRDVPAEYGPWGGSTTCSADGSGTAPGTRFSPAPVPGRREGCDHVGPEHRRHGMPRPSTCGRDLQAGRPPEGTTRWRVHRAR